MPVRAEGTTHRQETERLRHENVCAAQKPEPHLDVLDTVSEHESPPVGLPHDVVERPQNLLVVLIAQSTQ